MQMWTTPLWRSLSTNILLPKHDPIGTIALQDTPQGGIIPYSVKAAMSVHQHLTSVKRIAYLIEEKDTT